MESLLFGGANSVGKTEAITRLTQKLINTRLYQVIAGTLPPPHIGELEMTTSTRVVSFSRS